MFRRTVRNIRKRKEAIISTYQPCSCLVGTKYEKDECVDIKTGVKQVSELSPLLFIACMECIISKYKDNVGNFEDGDVLVYADDIACWSNNRGYLERSLICWKRCFEEAGLHINAQKTILLTVTKVNENIDEIQLENEHIREVTSVKWLKSIFTSDGDKNMREITERLTK